jgi:predicted ester cyclase
MEKRRHVLKLGLAASASVLLAPLRALLGATTTSSQTRLPQSTRPTPAEERVVRTFYGQGWSEGNTAVIASHPATAQECQRLLQRFRQAFPDLRVDVASITKVGDETHVRWMAHGTNRGSLGGLAPTGRKVNIPGSTKMKIVDGKIVSSTAEWDEAALQKQLSTASPR